VEVEVVENDGGGVMALSFTRDSKLSGIGSLGVGQSIPEKNQGKPNKKCNKIMTHV